MPAQEDAGARVESILDKVDREVARRRAQQQQSPPPIPEPLQDAAPAAIAPPVVAPAAAAPPAAPPAPAPAAPPAPVAAPEPSRPISLTDPNAPTPVTAQELTSGLAAARRRLAIVNTQLDELASEIEALNDQARRIREDRLAQSARPALSPRPVTIADQEAPAPAPIPVEPAPGPAALPTAAASIPAPEEPERPPLGAPEPVPEPPKQERPTAGMRVRPRPPAQSQRRVPAADQARLVAVELAVSGQTRGDVAELLEAQYADVDPQAILDSLFGPGTPPSARMSGT